MEFGAAAQMCELYASLLGAHFGISCPRPAIILIERDLAEATAQYLVGDARRQQIMRNSVGLNFGSQFLTNLATWPVDKIIPATLEEAALKIFAFDALIQNPDRTFQNPNLGTRGDDLFIYDHESAFSFLLSIFPGETPWLLTSEGYLENHVFANLLHGVRFPSEFTEALADLSSSVVNLFSDQIPIEWRSPYVMKIESHLKSLQEHAAEFADEVTRRLA
jgi:hypothetical protein